VPREFYSFLFSSLIGGSGTWRVGEWFIYPGPWDQGQEAQLEDTSVIVTRPHVEREGVATNSGACLCGWHYKLFSLGGYRPFTYDGGGAADTLILRRSEGGIELDPGVIEVGTLQTDGTVAEPAEVRSTVPGRTVTLDLAGDEHLEGCLALSPDVRVEGGVLTDC